MNAETDARPDRPTLLLLVLAVTGAGMLMHPYAGLIHDARLYALQALNHLHPDLYGNDVFLRFGSQDDYTLFTPMFAWLGARMGVEPAAAVLVAFSQLMFLAAAFVLARGLRDTRYALLALGLLVVMPDHYGAERIFSYLEEFITPRQLAEAWTLFAIAAWLRGHPIAAGALCLLSLLTHPIMGASGVAVLVLLQVPQHHDPRLLAVAAVTLVVVVAAGLCGLVPLALQMDPLWHDIVINRARYLDLANWPLDDWGRVACVGTTLLLAWQVLEGQASRLARAALYAAAALMMLALIGGDWLRISLVMQAQPWRAMWLATVVALILSPALVVACWRGSRIGRAGIVLLLAAWACPAEALALLIAPLAALAVMGARLPATERIQRLLLAAAWLVLAGIVVNALAVSSLSIRAGAYGIAASPQLNVIRAASAGATLPLLIAAATWWLWQRAGKPGRAAITAMLLAGVATTAAFTLPTWTWRRFDPGLKAAFAGWREYIPAGSDVLWAADSMMESDGASSTWFLLERPNYISKIQATSSLFSREAAIEIRERSRTVLGLVPDINLQSTREVAGKARGKHSFRLICTRSQVRYLVSSVIFPDAVPIEAPRNVRHPYRQLNLYICP
jgi:hypothetical protein